MQRSGDVESSWSKSEHTSSRGNYDYDYDETTIEKIVVQEGYSIDDVIPRRKKLPNKKKEISSLPEVAHAFEKAKIKVDTARLSANDVLLLRQLNLTYQTEMEVKQISNLARYQSMQEMSFIAVLVMVLLQIIAVVLCAHFADVSVADALLFAMYTVTSAGFGSVDIPKTSGFLLYVTLYVFLGISSLAILVRQCSELRESQSPTLFARFVQCLILKLSLFSLRTQVAQVYQYLEFENQRLNHARDKARMAREGLRTLKQIQDQEPTVETVIRYDLIRALKTIPQPRRFVRLQTRVTKDVNPELVYALGVGGFLTSLLAIGTFAMMAMEGWTFPEALYFSTFAMTSIGYGDLAPTKQSSTWFVVFWLPFNVAFLSLYLGTVAHYFVMISRWNVSRIKKSLTDSLESSSSLEHNNTVGEYTIDDTDSVENAVSRGTQRRERIRQNSDMSFAEELQREGAATVQDLLALLSSSASKDIPLRFNAPTDTAVIGSAKPTPLIEKLWRSTTATDEPSLALRFLVEKRLARIVATEVAGFESSMQIKGCTFFVTINSLKGTAEKWHIPRRARSAFRASAFESLFFVGEREIISDGLDGFLKLNPYEFNDLFRPFVMALGDKETMEAWLACTEVLVDQSPGKEMATIEEGGGEEDDDPGSNMGMRRSFHLSMKNEIEDYFPVNQGNAVRIQL
jgi:hypothetical protein